MYIFILSNKILKNLPLRFKNLNSSNVTFINCTGNLMHFHLSGFMIVVLK